LLRNPTVKNISLSADRFRDGIDARSKQITEWVTKASEEASNPVASTSSTADTNENQKAENKKDESTHTKAKKEDKPAETSTISYFLRSKQQEEQNEEVDEEIQVISENVKKKRPTAILRPKTIGAKRKTRKPTATGSPKKKISEFFKKQ
uniref:DNA polymerase delta subunit 3 n=1 Tax=Gongylonema pulchrum TaxID=637853 RepID=A0A183D896_9BILA